MASLSRFSDVLEEELNALTQKVIPERTKIATKYGTIYLSTVRKKINLKYQFDSFTQRIIAGVSSALVVSQ